MRDSVCVSFHAFARKLIRLLFVSCTLLYVLIQQWMVLEARHLVNDSGGDMNSNLPVDALNAFGYEEAAQHVYGIKVAEWKKRHQKKATSEQMERYKASEPIQAKHDKALLATRADKPKEKAATAVVDKADAVGAAVLSNVCCQDVEQVAAAVKDATVTAPAKHTRTVGPFQPPPIPAPASFARAPAIAILTVSDRAASNSYETGDLSGPAVAAAVCAITKQQRKDDMCHDGDCSRRQRCHSSQTQDVVQ